MEERLDRAAHYRNIPRGCALTVVLALSSLGAMGACRSRQPSGGAGSSAGAVAWLAMPEVPPALEPPPGAHLAAHVHASGAQIFVCKISAEGALGWSLEAPDARLFDAGGTEVGSHGAGPTWLLKDGSRVTASKIAQADAPRRGDIPWLLLEVTSTSGTGVLSAASYVQRVGTARGTVPPDGCLGANLGSEVRVDYSAEYFFYAGDRRATGPDAAAP
jgi:hypothetical protein